MNQQAVIKKGRKYEQVLEGAREVFLADGFEGASVDTIAKSAGVSKATLYSYFPDKRLLFMEVARTECHRQAEAAAGMIDANAAPRVVLEATGLHLIRFFLSRFGQRVFRICVAEAERFPELGLQFYQSGPCVVEERLVDYFTAAIARGELVIEDKPLAAHQFADLCKADLFPRLMFGVQTSFEPAEISRVIRGAVDMFIARYGAPG